MSQSNRISSQVYKLWLQSALSLVSNKVHSTITLIKPTWKTKSSTTTGKTTEYSVSTGDKTTMANKDPSGWVTRPTRESSVLHHFWPACTPLLSPLFTIYHCRFGTWDHTTKPRCAHAAPYTPLLRTWCPGWPRSGCGRSSVAFRARHPIGSAWARGWCHPRRRRTASWERPPLQFRGAPEIRQKRETVTSLERFSVRRVCSQVCFLVRGSALASSQVCVTPGSAWNRKPHLHVSGQGVHVLLVLENRIAESGDHQADRPGRVSLQLDDLVSAAAKNGKVVNTRRKYSEWSVDKSLLVCLWEIIRSKENSPLSKILPHWMEQVVQKANKKRTSTKPKMQISCRKTGADSLGRDRPHDQRENSSCVQIPDPPRTVICKSIKNLRKQNLRFKM